MMRSLGTSACGSNASPVDLGPVEGQTHRRDCNAARRTDFWYYVRRYSDANSHACKTATSCKYAV